MSEEKKSDRIINELKKKLEELLQGGNGDYFKSGDVNDWAFKEWFEYGYEDLTEDQKFLLSRHSSEVGVSLLSNLKKFWVISFRIHTCEAAAYMGKDEIIPPNAIIIMGSDLRRQGREYKDFWLKKKNYKSIVEKLTSTIKKDVDGLVQSFQSQTASHRSIETMNVSSRVVREVLDDFTNDLEIIRKGVEADLKKDFWEWAKEWLYPVAPAAVVLLVWLVDKWLGG